MQPKAQWNAACIHWTAVNTWAFGQENACFCNHWVLSNLLRSTIMAVIDWDSRLNKALYKLFFEDAHTELVPVWTGVSCVQHVSLHPSEIGRLAAWKYAKKNNGQDPPSEIRQHVHIQISVFGYYLEVSAIFKYQLNCYQIMFDGLTNLIKQQFIFLFYSYIYKRSVHVNKKY